MYPQLHPRHSRGSQAQKGVAMETRLLLSVLPVHRGQMIAPLISRDHNIHTHTPADSHAHTYTHMHHKYFHVHTVTSKNTHTLCIATQANKATILDFVFVYSVFLHKFKRNGVIHLELFMSVDMHTSSDLPQNSFFFNFLLDVCYCMLLIGTVDSGQIQSCLPYR